ncbi:DUF1028 domain-containing protein [Desulfurococcaceae archaeon MEX13E-LK6-19]|nr:DUF1028 domain-containing protein [Desulfurococcaceae archaeon MEX13E-LK6-19]
MTYSIIGIDKENNVLGIAVASGSIAVGSRVPWARYLVGGVATQAYTNPALGPLILDYLQKGLSPNEALEKALSNDPRKELRQVAVLDWNGRSAFYCGQDIPDEYAGYSLDNCVCIANLVVSKDIPKAMCETFKVSINMGLAEALLEALREAHDMGGDRRGDLSAAIIIVGKTEYLPYYDKILDLRIDYSKDPVKELIRLYRLIRV